MGAMVADITIPIQLKADWRMSWSSLAKGETSGPGDHLRPSVLEVFATRGG